MTSATSLATGADASRSTVLPPLLVKPSFGSTSSFPSAKRTHSGPGSGQPSSSLIPFSVSGCSGHLSTASGMPSLSLSGSGQPSSSSNPSSSSGSSGHLSTLSGMPSPSLSSVDDGQPSLGFFPWWSSGAFGQASLRSGMP